MSKKRTTIAIWILPIWLTGWVLGWLSHSWWQPTPATDTNGIAQQKPDTTVKAAEKIDNASSGDTLPTAAEAGKLANRAATPPSNYRHEFAAELAQHDVAGFIDLLDEYRNSKNLRELPFLALFKETLASWLQNGQAEQVLSYTQTFLERFYFDADIFQLQAAAQLKNHQSLQAIKTLFTQYERTTVSTDAAALHLAIDHVVESYQQELEQQKHWQDLLALYDFLVVADPGNAGYYLAQAKTLVEIEDYANARLALAHVYDDPVLGVEARALLQRMKNTERGEIRIPLQSSGKNYAVNAMLDERYPVTLLVDTGASISSISRAYFNKIRSDAAPVYLDELSVQTANGSVKAPRYRFHSLALHGVTVRDVDILVMDDLPADHGLLGMNVLGQFPFRIDQENAILLLNSQ